MEYLVRSGKENTYYRYSTYQGSFWTRRRELARTFKNRKSAEEFAAGFQKVKAYPEPKEIKCHSGIFSWFFPAQAKATGTNSKRTLA